jgi:hypothetical protein
MQVSTAPKRNEDIVSFLSDESQDKKLMLFGKNDYFHKLKKVRKQFIESFIQNSVSDIKEIKGKYEKIYSYTDAVTQHF